MVRLGLRLFGEPSSATKTRSVDQLVQNTTTTIWNSERTCLRKHFELLKDASWEKEELTKSEQDVLETRARDSRPEERTFIGGWTFSKALGAACNDRQFAVTRKGYMAIVLLFAKPGDSVCLIFGADVPFVLRKAPTKQSSEKYGRKQCYYNLVGECYVHGIMDGEGWKVLIGGIGHTLRILLCSRSQLGMG